jgi:hypothetical protein
MTGQTNTYFQGRHILMFRTWQVNTHFRDRQILTFKDTQKQLVFRTEQKLIFKTGQIVTLMTGYLTFKTGDLETNTDFNDRTDKNWL